MKPPRRLSPWQIRWMLSLYPPLLLTGVRVVNVGADFRTCRVRVARSFVTRNLQGTTFGGTIFSAADPFHAILYWQALAHRGIRAQAWLKSAAIAYRRPASTALTLDFTLSEDDVDSAARALESEGRFERTHRVDAVDEHGRVCAEIEPLVHLRLPPEGQPGVTGF